MEHQEVCHETQRGHVGRARPDRQPQGGARCAGPQAWCRAAAARQGGRLLIEKKVQLDLSRWVGHAVDDGLSTEQALSELRGRPVPWQAPDGALNVTVKAKAKGKTPGSKPPRAWRQRSMQVFCSTSSRVRRVPRLPKWRCRPHLRTAAFAYAQWWVPSWSANLAPSRMCVTSWRHARSTTTHRPWLRRWILHAACAPMHATRGRANALRLIS